MKFCTHCGQQIEDGMMFCPACGSAQDNAAPGGRQAYGSGKYSRQNAPGDIGEGIRTLQPAEITVFVGFIVAFIAMFMPHISISLLGSTESASYAMTGDLAFVLNLLLILAGCAVTVVDRFFKPLRKDYVFAAGVAQLVTILIYIIWWIMLNVYVSDYYGIKFGFFPSFGAFFYVAGLIAVVVGTFMKKNRNLL